MGHIGLTPQRQAGLSGYKVQGKTIFRAKEIFFEALALQEAGAFSIVLEAVPSIVASVITSSLKIPTIGIGAGPSTSGQVLVYLDAVGMFDKFTPRFCKTYANMGSISKMAIEEYRSDVKNKVFPDPQLHSYGMESTEMEEEFKAWAAALKKN